MYIQIKIAEFFMQKDLKDLFLIVRIAWLALKKYRYLGLTKK
jgi:hypothetical protein